MNPTAKILATRMLSSGFGVEDIALKLQLSVDEVRAFIVELRTSGALVELYRRKE